MSKHIIAKRINGQLHPTTAPVQHDSYTKALTEAERLANANPGCEFVVMSESHSVMVEADIPTSTLYKAATPAGVYAFMRYGDGTQPVEVAPYRAYVGELIPGWNCETRPVVFMDCNQQIVDAPKTRNVRWKLMR